MDKERRIDTLSIKQRMAFRTNAFDWLLVIPNIGVEFDLFPYNYNRWSVGLNLRWKPKTQHTYVVPFNYNLFEIALEGREYWRERTAEPNGRFKPHTKFWDRLWSCRRRHVRHANWIFYRGGYLAYGQYSFILTTHHWGRQGDYVSAGFTWGFVKPFKGFENGSSLDLEFGVSGGLVMTNYERLMYGKFSNCYYSDGEGKTGWKMLPYPVVRDLHVGVVYRLGNYPIQKKYRWKYDVDIKFQEKMDSIYDVRTSQREKKYIADSIYKIVAARYKVLYDSLDAIYDVKEQSRRDELPVKRDSVNTNKIRDLRGESRDTLQDAINEKKDKSFFHKVFQKKKQKKADAAAQKAEKKREAALKPKKTKAEKATEKEGGGK